MNKTFLACAGTILLAVAARAEADLPAIFVAPFDGEAAKVEGWQPALGAGLAEMLITELGKTGKFTVLESTVLNALKDEIKLGEEGYAAKEEKVEKGGFAGADFMFRATVTRFGSKTTRVGLGGFAPRGLGNLGVSSSNSDVRIDWRIVDAATRKIVKTGSAVGEQKGTGFDIGASVNGHGGNIGFNNQEFMDSALGKATVKALKAIIESVSETKLPESGRRQSKQAVAEKKNAEAQAAMDALKNTPGKVLAAPGGNVLIVSLGSKHGLKTGDKLKLFQTVDTKDDEGKVVFTDEILIGEITLESVQEEKSKARYEGEAKVKPGWLVRN